MNYFVHLYLYFHVHFYVYLYDLMYSECSRFHENRFTFGGVIPERVNTIKRALNCCQYSTEA